MTARRVAAALVWTAGLVLAIYTIDRVLLGGREGAAWVAAAEPAAIPKPVGPVAIPSYLPDLVRWPPQEVRYRAGDRPGWWLGIGDGDQVALWIGSGVDPVPSVMGEAGRCAIAAERCPEGWRALSAPLTDGRTVYVITRLEPRVATQILKDLRW